MDPLQSLSQDHRLIARVLDAFETYVGYVEASVAVDHFDLQRFVAFFQDYGDLYHHDKEESLLFPALVAFGVDWSDGPLARLRQEHDQEHYLLSSLEHAALCGEPWSKDDRLHFLNVAKEFVSFQRNHMRFENTEVFPLAERVLRDLGRERLTRDMDRLDRASRDRVLRSTELAEVLVRRYTLNQTSQCVGSDRVEADRGRQR